MSECSICGQKCSETYFPMHITEHIVDRQEGDRG